MVHQSEVMIRISISSWSASERGADFSPIFGCRIHILTSASPRQKLESLFQLLLQLECRPVTKTSQFRHYMKFGLRKEQHEAAGTTTSIFWWERRTVAEMEQDGINPNERPWEDKDLCPRVWLHVFGKASQQCDLSPFLAVQPPKPILWPSYKFPGLTTTL